MDSNTAMIALSGQICGTVLLLSLLVLWARRRRSEPTMPQDSVRRIENRLTEMQQALDTIALEVERVSEAQRFATKLLSERAPGSMVEVDSSRERSPLSR